MTTTQKVIKYCAIVFALLLIISIFSGIMDICAAIFSSFRKDSDVAGENKIYELSDWESVKNLDIEVSAAALEIKSGAAFALESNHKYLKAVIKNGALVIDETGSFRVKSADGVQVVLTVPEGFSFDRIRIRTGAGRLDADALCAETLHMELGAGETVLEHLDVTGEAEIETGVGRLSVLGGSIAELDMGIGVGGVSVKTAILEEGEIDCGIGSTEIILIGAKEDYTVSVSKGVGTARVDGASVASGEKIGGGNARVKLNGGIGEICVLFAEQE